MYPFWPSGYYDFAYASPKMVKRSARDLLGEVLDVIRREGWSVSGWGFTPPWNIAHAMYGVVCEEFHLSSERDLVQGEMRGLLNAQCREGFLLWECQTPRTEADVIDLLERAIESVGP
jgi:hypothetical protein